MHEKINRFSINFDLNTNARHRALVVLFGASMLLLSQLACGDSTDSSGNFIQSGTHDYHGVYCDNTGDCIEEEFYNSTDGGCPSEYSGRPLTSCTTLR